ncbi:MAG: hypothetical protein FJW39_19160 [Acidobacteria bacterium]|nr:hypothetical protein [Acidobacteriota bacterium]
MCSPASGLALPLLAAEQASDLASLDLEDLMNIQVRSVGRKQQVQLRSSVDLSRKTTLTRGLRGGLSGGSSSVL